MAPWLNMYANFYLNVLTYVYDDMLIRQTWLNFGCLLVSIPGYWIKALEKVACRFTSTYDKCTVVLAQVKDFFIYIHIIEIILQMSKEILTIYKKNLTNFQKYTAI